MEQNYKIEAKKFNILCLRITSKNIIKLLEILQRKRNAGYDVTITALN